MCFILCIWNMVNEVQYIKTVIKSSKWYMLRMKMYKSDREKIIFCWEMSKDIVKVVVQSVIYVWLSVIPCTATHQASLSFTISQSLIKLMSIESVMPSNHLSSSFPPAFNLSQHQSLLLWVGCSHHMVKGLELQLQHQSLQWIFRTDFL